MPLTLKSSRLPCLPLLRLKDSCPSAIWVDQHSAKQVMVIFVLLEAIMSSRVRCFYLTQLASNIHPIGLILSFYTSQFALWRIQACREVFCFSHERLVSMKELHCLPLKLDNPFYQQLICAKLIDSIYKIEKALANAEKTMIITDRTLAIAWQAC